MIFKQDPITSSSSHVFRVFEHLNVVFNVSRPNVHAGQISEILLLHSKLLKYQPVSIVYVYGQNNLNLRPVHVYIFKYGTREINLVMCFNHFTSLFIIIIVEMRFTCRLKALFCRFKVSENELQM